MLDSPTRLANLALIWRHRVEGFLIQIENDTVRTVADRVSLDLDAALERKGEHRQQLFFFVSKEPRSVVVGILFEQRRAFRAKRAVEHNLDSSKRESAVELARACAVTQ